MKYFLSHRMRKDSEQVVNEAFNTFLLALDGDVDFEPEAVMHLLRRMKKNPMVGAACGRIHPIGAGKSSFFNYYILKPTTQMSKFIIVEKILFVELKCCIKPVQVVRKPVQVK